MKKKNKNKEDRQLWPALKLKMMKRRSAVELFWKPVTSGVWQVPPGIEIETAGALQ